MAEPCAACQIIQITPTLQSVQALVLHPFSSLGSAQAGGGSPAGQRVSMISTPLSQTGNAGGNKKRGRRVLSKGFSSTKRTQKLDAVSFIVFGGLKTVVHRRFLENSEPLSEAEKSMGFPLRHIAASTT